VAKRPASAHWEAIGSSFKSTVPDAFTPDETRSSMGADTAGGHGIRIPT
jgi:hypothetical protein